MIIGIGTDIIEIDRVSNTIINKVLTDKEIEKYNTLSKTRQREFLSGRFSAKESIMKALGKGMNSINFLDIEILSNDDNKPFVTLKNNMKQYEDYNFFISISHNKNNIISMAVIEDLKNN